MKDKDNSVLGSIQGATPAVRLRKGMDALIAHRKRGLVHYTMTSRRMTIVRKKLIPPFGSTVIYEDCSSAVTGLWYMAGLHDPNDLHFSGWGYTGTLVQHGRKVTAPRVGDMVFYGGSASEPHHVVCVYAPGQVWSHGSEGGPVLRPIDYRSDRVAVRRYF